MNFREDASFAKAIIAFHVALFFVLAFLEYKIGLDRLFSMLERGFGMLVVIFLGPVSFCFSVFSAYCRLTDKGGKGGNLGWGMISFQSAFSIFIMVYVKLS
jgi:hypothetical protein